MLRPIALAALLLTPLLPACGEGDPTPPSQTMTATFHTPDEGDLLRLAQQWTSLDQLVQEQYDSTLDLSTHSLDLLQLVLEDELIEPDSTYGLQCIGVALGRIMAENIDGLDWAVVNDSWGRDVCLRYKDSSFQIGVVTMVSKRVEEGEPVDVRALYAWIEGMVVDLAGRVD